MSSELLEFTGQIEFDFKMSSYAERGQKEELEGDCKQVVSHAKSSFKEMCLLSLKLSEIKQKGQWENVINPETGYTFLNNTFDEFTKYAFDLSKTKTSNLLRLSQFVCWYGEERGEIEPAYKSYGYSQLVELASVPPEHRAYFHSEMSVDEMRIAKYYIKMGPFYEEKKKVGFDLLTKAQEWKESEQKQTPVPARSPEGMDGQLSLFSEENEEENERGEASPNPTSDLTQVCEEVETDDQSEAIAPMKDDYEPDEGEIWQGGGIDRADFVEDQDDPDYLEADEYDEADEAQEDMRGDMQTIEEAAEASVSEAPRVDLSKNLKIREFMHGFEKWGRMYCAYPLEFMKVYYHEFRNGKAILAVLSPCCSDMEKMERDHSTVRYYWKNGTNEDFFEVTTRELERVLPLINEEL